MTELQYKVLEAITLDAGRTRQEVIRELREAEPKLKSEGINYAIDRLIEMGKVKEQDGQLHIINLPPAQS